MDRQTRLRRVVLTMASFARNVAYHQAFLTVRSRVPKTAAHDFWATLSGNYIDAAVLEWCKLFADDKGKHHWSNIVADPAAFEALMLDAARRSPDEFAGYCKAMRHYRDKFVAHLDSDEVMDIPLLEPAGDCVRFYHHALVASDADAAVTFHGLPASSAALQTYFQEQRRTARIAFDTLLPVPHRES